MPANSSQIRHSRCFQYSDSFIISKLSNDPEVLNSLIVATVSYCGCPSNPGSLIGAPWTQLAESLRKGDHPDGTEVLRPDPDITVARVAYPQNLLSTVLIDEKQPMEGLCQCVPTVRPLQ